MMNLEAFTEALRGNRLKKLYEIVEEELGSKPSPQAIAALFTELQKDEQLAKLFTEITHAELERIPKYKFVGILAMLDFFPNFEYLMLWSDASYKDTKLFARPSRIKQLEFIRWRKLQDISDLAQLKALKSLRFVEADSLTDLSPLRELPNFDKLALDVFRPDLNLNALADSSLKELHLRYYPHQSLAPIAKLQGLEELWMKLSYELESIEDITALRNLKDLHIEVAPKVADFAPIQKLEQLERLWLSLLAGFKEREIDLRFVRQMPQLQSLIIERMPKEIQDISFLEGLEIKELRLAFLYEISDISVIGTLSKLEELHFERNTKLEDFSPLQKLPNLKRLWLFNCQLKERGLAEAIQAMLPNCRIAF